MAEAAPSEQEQLMRVRRLSSESDKGPEAVDEGGGVGGGGSSNINNNNMMMKMTTLNTNTNTNNNNNNNSKAARLPRWTRQEILVLIEGKRVAETRVRRGRVVGLGSSSVEPKWATVSSYCKRHGVNRGPVQCRKRWSNLAGDFKKIKDWEARHHNHNYNTESYWVMRNDLRRERRLPGFFDKEVYDILENPISTSTSTSTSAHPNPIIIQQSHSTHTLTHAPQNEEDKEDDVDNDNDNEVRLSLTLADDIDDSTADPDSDSEEEDEDNDDDNDSAEAVVFDSGRTAAADHALFTTSTPFQFPNKQHQADDYKDSPNPIPIPSPPSAIPIPLNMAPSPLSGHNEKLNPEIGSTSREGRKRRRFVAQDDQEEETCLEDQLIQVLDRNGRMLTAQLEAHNTNLKLDREDRKDYATSLVTVLNKLADALGRVADKL